MRHMGPHNMLGTDPASVRGAHLDRRLVRRVWSFARPYRGMLLAFLVTIVLGALVGILPPLFIKRIIDTAIPQQDNGMVTSLALLMVAIAVGDALLSLGERWWSAKIGEGLIFELRRSLFDHTQRMPIAFFTRTQTGALISRMNNDVIGAQRALTGTLGSVVSNIVTLAFTLGAMAFLEWRLTILTLILLPLFILPAKRIGRQLQAITREGMDLNSEMNTTMTERFNVAGALLVKLFGRHDDEADDFSRRAGRVRDIGVRSAMYGRVFFIALTLVGAIATAAVYLVGGHLVISGAITLGTMVALGTYVARVYGPLTALTNARVDIMSAFVSFERVFEVLDTPNAIVDAPGATDLGRPRGQIELDDVWFRYPAASDVSIASLESDPTSGKPLPDTPGAFVLRGVTASIDPGQLVALVGPSGGGKTTISNLIPRLYDVTTGTVRVDGHDVRDVTQASLRAAIGVVAQDPHLFHDTVLANLRYARPDASIESIHAACRAAQIHDVIVGLPDGYDTVVGERGYRLSGGEKQRVAIARVLLKDPAVVVLDEATSHLDSESEAAVQSALATALAGRTAVVIAHRLSTITNADQILVVDEGRIVERGLHRELLEADGLYAEHYRTLLRSDVESIT
ncbi:MAG TPA: ABC transporter ATP-binding protein [Acidimicrobiales bacterium]|nr:ABC transporter ATP-binding protein [Acidimicrobiales bacterium]